MGEVGIFLGWKQRVRRMWQGKGLPRPAGVLCVEELWVGKDCSLQRVGRILELEAR